MRGRAGALPGGKEGGGDAICVHHQRLRGNSNGSHQSEVEQRARPLTSDDHVIYERRPDDDRALGDSTREHHVFVTRRRVAAGMVVNDHDGARRVSKCDAQDIADPDVKTVDPSRCHTSCSPKAMPPVEGQDPKLFVVETTKLGARP